MTVLLWSASALLALHSLVVLLCNLGVMWHAWRSGRGYSSIPLLAALFGAAACVVCPASGSSWLALAFLVVDFTIPLFAWAVFVNGAFSSLGSPVA